MYTVAWGTLQRYLESEMCVINTVMRRAFEIAAGAPVWSAPCACAGHPPNTVEMYSTYHYVIQSSSHDVHTTKVPLCV